MTYFATYLGSITSTEKTEVEAAMRLSVFGDASFTMKPNGNGRNGVLDAKHDDATGYLMHLRMGSNSGSGTFAIGIGTDEGSGGGLLISAKNGNAAGFQLAHNPGATIGAYLINYASQPALHIDNYGGGGGIKLQAKTGQGYADGVSTAASTTFTSATAAFTGADVGQTITQLTNVGSQASNCIVAGTTIAAVIDANTVTLSQAAGASSTGIRFRVGGRAMSNTQNFLRLVDVDGSTIRGAIQYNLFDWRTPMQVTNNTAASVAMVVKGAASQSADMFNVLDSAGTQLFRVQSTGRITAAYSSFLSNAGLTSQPAVGISSYSATLPGLQIAQENNSSPSGNLVELLDYANAITSRFDKDGYFMTRKTAAPADAQIANGEAAIWFDSANGAGKLKIKAKTANGTVVAGEVALA